MFFAIEANRCRDKGRCGADAGALCLSWVPARFPTQDKHKAQYISIKGFLASYGRGKNRQFELANRLYLTRKFP